MNKQESTTKVESFSMDDFDDFLPISPDSIEDKDEPKKPSVFTKETVDTKFLNDDLSADSDDDNQEGDDESDQDGADDKKKEENEDSADAEDLDALLGNPGDDEEEGEDTDNIVSKNLKGTHKIFEKLIADEVLIGFEDDKPLSDYKEKDFVELITENLKEREDQLKNELPKQFIDSLPPELRYAATYYAEGGKDMKSLFKALSYSEESRSLDPDKDGADILRKYFTEKNVYESDEDLEAQIEEWETLGVLEKKAKQFKPKLDAIEQKKVEAQVVAQQKVREQQELSAKKYMNNVYDALKEGDINGIKLTKKKQQFLFQELTGFNHTGTASGRPINLLAHKLEEHQFSKNPRFDLIAEATWLLSDPEGYREELRKSVTSEVTKDTAKQLKTEQGRRLATSNGTGQSEQQQGASVKRKKRTIKKQRNIFKR